MFEVCPLSQEDLEKMLSEKRAELIDFNRKSNPDPVLAIQRAFFRGKLEGQIDLLSELIRKLSV